MSERMVLLVAVVRGEDDASLIAGLATLVGLLLGVIAVAAVYETNKDQKDKRSPGEARTWALGFAALFFASFGTAGGLWDVSGRGGRAFIIVALVVTVLVTGVIIWGKQLRRHATERRVIPLKKPKAKEQNDGDAE